MLLAALGFGAAVCGAGLWWYGDVGATSRFASESLLRIAIVLGCLWMAWPSLKRPAAWLPAGVAGACLVGLMAIAARPKLVVMVVPVVGVIATLATVKRMFSSR